MWKQHRQISRKKPRNNASPEPPCQPLVAQNLNIPKLKANPSHLSTSRLTQSPVTRKHMLRPAFCHFSQFQPFKEAQKPALKYNHSMSYLAKVKGQQIRKTKSVSNITHFKSNTPRTKLPTEPGTTKHHYSQNPSPQQLPYHRLVDELCSPSIRKTMKRAAVLAKVQEFPSLFTRELKLPIIYKSTPYVGKHSFLKFEEMGRKLKEKQGRGQASSGTVQQVDAFISNVTKYESNYSTPLLSSRNNSMGNTPLFTLCDQPFVQHREKQLESQFSEVESETESVTEEIVSPFPLEVTECEEKVVSKEIGQDRARWSEEDEERLFQFRESMQQKGGRRVVFTKITQ